MIIIVQAHLLLLALVRVTGSDHIIEIHLLLVLLQILGLSLMDLHLLLFTTGTQCLIALL